MSETSKCSILLAPLSPASNRFQVGSTPHPSGVSIPKPVTTTRLILGFQCGLHERAPRRHAARDAAKPRLLLHVAKPQLPINHRRNQSLHVAWSCAVAKSA